MKRSTYSLILSDEVVRAIDAMAYQSGTSRSNYINQILAKHVSYETPEQRMKQIFTSLLSQMDTTFRVMEQVGGNTVSLFHTVQYKYSPNVRYSVELGRNAKQNAVVNLKVTCRTQNAVLIEAMNTLYLYWAHLEQLRNFSKYLNPIEVNVSDGKLLEQLEVVNSPDTETLGQAISSYINGLNLFMQCYFSGLRSGLDGHTIEKMLQENYIQNFG